MKMAVLVGVGAVLAMVALGSEQAADVRVQVGDVKDSRTTGKFFANLEIELKLMGDDLDGAKGLRCTVTKAVDDTGRNLLKEEREKSSFSDINDNSMEIIETTSLEETYAFGRRFAQRLAVGDCVALIGDLGRYAH